LEDSQSDPILESLTTEQRDFFFKKKVEAKPKTKYKKN
jgi:hypothetical protein